MALPMHSPKKQVNGMIQIRMAMATIWNILMVKLGVLQYVAIVARPRLVTQHLTAGVVLTLMEMGGQTLQPIG